jgi:hypothetical protein
MSQSLTFPSGVSSTDERRAWALVSTCHAWCSWHRSWDVNWFSKQSAVPLAFSFMWYVIPKGPWTVVGPQRLRCDLTVPYFHFPLFECLLTGHSSDGFVDTTVVLLAGSWVTCHSFPNVCSCYTRHSKPESIILLVDSVYAKAIEAVKSWATLSDSSPDLILILNLCICQPGLKDSKF